MHEWLHKLRLRLWRRQARVLERSLRATGTSEGDWIGANVAASAASSGAGAQSGSHGAFALCGGHSDGGS